MGERVLTYEPSLTCEAFHNAPVGSYEFKGIRGGVGSGKSVACCWDIRTKGEMQPAADVPDPCSDGKFHKVRWSCWLVGRQTLPQLKNTTIPTWMQWFGQDTHLVESIPAHARYEAPSMHNDGTWCRIDLKFYAMDSKNINDDLPSLEISGAWINEACQVDWEKIHTVNTRVGRFQPVKGVMLNSFGVIMDTNPPSENNWWYRKEQIEREKGFLWFVQPPAMIKTRGLDGKVMYIDNDARNAKRYGILPAENVKNLKGGFQYYRKQLVGATEDKIKRLVLNQYGTSADGMPIYPEWNPDIHAKEDELPFFKGIPLICGTDFGRTPSMVFCQMGPDGIFRVLDELTTENMSIDQFVKECARPKLVERFGWPGCQVVNFADPAGLAKGQNYNTTCIDVLNMNGIPTRPSPDIRNDFNVRRDAVGDLLRQIYKGVPAFQIQKSRCKALVKGFNGWYCYKRMRSGSDDSERYAEGPDKTNPYSHPHDALQYAVLGATRSGVDFSSAGVSDRDWSYLTEGVDDSYV